MSRKARQAAACDTLEKCRFPNAVSTDNCVAPPSDESQLAALKQRHSFKVESHTVDDDIASRSGLTRILSCHTAASSTATTPRLAARFHFLPCGTEIVEIINCGMAAELSRIFILGRGGGFCFARSSSTREPRFALRSSRESDWVD